MTTIEICKDSITQVDADVVIAGYFSDALPEFANELSESTEDFVGNLMNNGDFDAKSNEVLVLPYPVGLKANRLVLVGLGEKKDFGPKEAIQAAGSAAKSVASKERERVAIFFPEAYLSESIAGALVGTKGQDILRTDKKLIDFGTLLVASGTSESIEIGRVLGESINQSRYLVNQPANILYPESLAEQAKQIGADSGFEVEIWDQDRLEKESCNTLLAVAQGSAKPPRLLIMRYKGTNDNSKHLGLVGKGVTFDSGGYSLKPSDAMFDMKCDMGGAATVIGAMKAIAELKLSVQVTGYCGLVENMVSGAAFKLGDVIKTRNGKTVEIHNTDAEGRLVLADVLDVAVKEKVTHLVDFATLTGACLVALGTDCAGVFTNDQSWCDQFLSAASTTGEDSWQLPMTPNFGEQIRSNVADIKNMGNGRWGGAITAAKFLEEFVEDVPWIHVDIAGPAWSDSPRKWIDGGGSGCFIRTLVEMARTY